MKSNDPSWASGKKAKMLSLRGNSGVRKTPGRNLCGPKNHMSESDESTVTTKKISRSGRKNKATPFPDSDAKADTMHAANRESYGELNEEPFLPTLTSSVKIEVVEQHRRKIQSSEEEDVYYVLKNVSSGSTDQLIQSMGYCDLLLVSRSSKICEAHRAIFSSHSSLFEQTLRGQEKFSISVVHLPDYEFEEITNLIRFLYFGSILLPVQDSISLQRTMKELQFQVSPPTALSLKTRHILTEKGFIDIALMDVMEKPLKYTPGLMHAWRRREERKLVEEAVKHAPDIVQVDVQKEQNLDELQVENVEMQGDMEHDIETLVDQALEKITKGKAVESFQSVAEYDMDDDSVKVTPDADELNMFMDLGVNDDLPEPNAPQCDEWSQPSPIQDDEPPERIFQDLMDLDGTSSESEGKNPSPFFINGFLGGGKEGKNAKKTARSRRYSKCSICGVEFLFNRLLQHMRKDHSFRGQTYFCAYCPEVFLEKSERTEHEATHPESIEECEICGYKTDRRKIRQHRDSAHLLKVKQYKCDICSETVPQSEKLQHMRRHSECISRFACDKCGKVYYRNHTLMMHMQAEHSEKKQFYCSTCKKFFNSEEERKEHIKVHKRRDEKACKVCSEKLSTALFLAHMKRHALHEIQPENPLICPRCSRKFEKAEHTVNHMIGHLDPPRPSECDICFLPSKTATLQEKHKLREHITAKKQKVKRARALKACVKCGLLQPEGERYKRHLLQHAFVEIGQDESETDVQCPVCFRIFPCTMYTANHYLCHYEPERVFECERCFTPTRTETDLAFHRSRCLGKRVYDTRSANKKAKAEKKVILGSATFAWLCSECALVFETEQECEAHCASLHTYEEVQC